MLRAYQKLGGGYLLARPADTITLANVYSAVVHKPYVNVRRARLSTRETRSLDQVLETIVRSASRTQLSVLGAFKLSDVL